MSTMPDMAYFAMGPASDMAHLTMSTASDMAHLTMSTASGPFRPAVYATGTIIPVAGSVQAPVPAAVQSAIHTFTAAIKSALDTVSLAVQMPLDAIASPVKAFGQALAPVRPGLVGQTVKAFVDAFAFSIQAVIDAVALYVQTVLNAISCASVIRLRDGGHNTQAKACDNDSCLLHVHICLLVVANIPYITHKARIG